VKEQRLLEEARQISERGRVYYDAFLAYSHAADSKLALDIRQGLHLLSKPWYGRRALRVYCDQMNLTACPELWGSVVRALENSRFLLLLASPTAAASPWIAREVEWWIDHHTPPPGLFLVLTDDVISWDERLQGFNWSGTTALPVSLSKASVQEPVWVDLRWTQDTRIPSRRARGHHARHRRDVRFQDAIAALAAPIHGVPKDDLLSEDVRMHRRAIQLLWAAITVIVILTTLASVATVIAISG
jgi:hypothetical protein